VENLKTQSSISQVQWNTVNEELLMIKATYSNSATGYEQDAIEAVNSLPNSDPQKARLLGSVNSFRSLQKQVVAAILVLKKDIADLANKIVT
jgi:hypothetical protein